MVRPQWIAYQGKRDQSWLPTLCLNTASQFFADGGGLTGAAEMASASPSRRGGERKDVASRHAVNPRARRRPLISDPAFAQRVPRASVARTPATPTVVPGLVRISLPLAERGEVWGWRRLVGWIVALVENCQLEAATPDLASRCLRSGVNDGSGTASWRRRDWVVPSRPRRGHLQRNRLQPWDSELSATLSIRSDPLKTGKNRYSPRLSRIGTD